MKGKMQRIFAGVLAAVLLFVQPVGVLALEPGTPFEEAGPTEMALEATETTAVTETTAPTDVVTPTPTLSPTESPAPVPTVALTPTPTPTPTLDPTAAPTAALTPTPTLTIAATDAPTDVPPPTQEPWDETLCDHANENCLLAPACDVPGCIHIGKDVHGLDMPLCEKGAWILDQQDALLRARQSGKVRMLLSAVPQTITINLEDGDIVLYRSGNYVIKGDKRPEGKITVAENRIVSLTLENCKADVLILSPKVQANIMLKGLNAVSRLQLGNEAKVVYLSGGALDIGETVLGTNSTVEVQGGSIKANFTEKNGAQRADFSAEGVTSCTVNGADYSANQPHADGKMYLWLPAPKANYEYKGQVANGILAVREAPSAAPEGDGVLLDLNAQPNVTLTQPGVYRVTGSVSIDTTITFDGDGISLILDHVTLNANHNFKMWREAVLELRGSNSISQMAIDSFNYHMLTITGSGSLDLASPLGFVNRINVMSGNIHSPMYYITPGRFLINGQEAQLVTVGSVGLTSTCILEGRSIPVLWKDATSMLLPVLPADKEYRIAQDGSVINISVVSAPSPQYFYLKNGIITISANGTYVIDGEGVPTSNFIQLTDGVTANITLKGVHISGPSIPMVIGSGANVNFTVAGDNRLENIAGPGFLSNGAMTIGGSGTLTVQGALPSQQTGLSILANVSIIPGFTGNPGIQPSVILVTDGEGHPVASRDVTLKIGGEAPTATRTMADGKIYVWRSTLLNQQDVAVSDGKNTYTAVILNGQGNPADWLPIENVQSVSKEEGTEITFSAPDAGTSGVQYVVGDTAQALPDTYVADASRHAASAGKVLLTGLTPGKTITFRVYGAREAGAQLTANTVDGFTFSPIYTIMVRGPYAPALGDIGRVYDGTPYTFSGAPEGVAVTYTGEGLQPGETPVDAGTYTLTLTVPQDHVRYFATTVQKEFAIAKAPGSIVLSAPLYKSYDGVPVSLSNVSALGGAEVTAVFYKGNTAQGTQIDTPVNVGIYTVKLQAEASRNYEAAERTITFEIAKGTNDLHVVCEDVTYGDKPSPSIENNDGGKVTWVYKGYNGTSYSSTKAPVKAGYYKAVATAEATENLNAATAEAAFRILPRTVTIIPEPNQMKFEGDMDPFFFYTAWGLLDEDTLTGDLSREEGEAPGSYAYVVDGLSAGNNYRVVLDSDATPFTILPMMGWGFPGGGGSTAIPIVPIHQIIQLSDKHKLDIILNTTEKLTINKESYGKLFTDTEDGKVRPFSPSFRVNSSGNEVLLSLETEPELNKDGGYATDSDGKLIYRGRQLTMTQGLVNKLVKLGITHISFSVADMTVLYSLADLNNEAIRAIAAQEKTAISKAKFQIMLTPVTTLTAQEQAGISGMLPAGRMFRLTAQMVLDDETFDIAPLMKSLKAAVDMEDIYHMAQSLEGFEEDTFAAAYGLLTLPADEQKAQIRPGVFITPYLFTEMQAPFSGLRRSRRYLLAAVQDSGLYALIRKP